MQSNLRNTGGTSICTYLCGGDEDGLLADLGAVERLARVDVEHEEVAHLGDHEDDVMLRAHLYTIPHHTISHHITSYVNGAGARTYMGVYCTPYNRIGANRYYKCSPKNRCAHETAVLIVVVAYKYTFLPSPAGSRSLSLSRKAAPPHAANPKPTLLQRFLVNKQQRHPLPRPCGLLDTSRHKHA